jgi:chitin-binding protein
VTGDRKVKKLSTQRLWAGVSQLIKPASLVILAMTSTLAIHEATAHGYVSSPKSRVIQCKEDNIETPQSPACQAAKAAGTGGLYTPQEVAVGGVKDNHMSFIPDGRLCSANRANLYGMDLARNDWLATSVSPGVRQFVWTNTAAHKTKYFRYYITPQGYNHTQPLRWSDLTLIHDSGPAGQEWISTHNVNLPNRTGRHIIYSIWQRDWDTDAAEGFYQCIDVVFSGGTTSSTGTVSSSSRPASSSSVGTTSSISSDTCASLGTWNAGTIYQPPTSVKHNGKRYQAAYWTQGNDPATNSAGQGSPWIDLGTCSGTVTSSVAGTSSSRSSSSVAVSSSSVSTGNCSSPTYTSGPLYPAGALVQRNGSEYRCTVYGWCGLANADWAYAPGTGSSWQQAWVYVRSCQ